MANDLRGSLYPQPSAGLSVFQTWTLALAPSEQNYLQIANDPKGSLGRAYLWLFVASLIGGFISTLVSAGVNLVLGPTANPLLSGLGAGSITQQSTLINLVCGVPIIAVLTLVGVSIGAGLSYMLARALGGQGTFTQVMYTYSAYFVPLILFNSLISNIPCVGLLVIITGVYGLALNVIATKAVHQFGWGQAVMASVIVPIIALVLVACVVILVLALLGPAIGNVFSGIVTDI